MKKTVLTLALLIAAAAVPAGAQVTTLVQWNFNNSTAGSGGAAGTFNTTGTTEIFDTDTEFLSIAGDGLLASSATVNFSDLAGAMGGTANNNWGTFGGVLPGTTTTNGGAIAVIGSGNNGNYIDFSFSTSGFDEILVSFDTRGTSTGYTTQTWSIVGGSTLETFTGRNVTTFSNLEIESPELTNLASVTLRVTFSGATSTSGNNRIDNFTVTGVAIPEPSTYAALLGLVTFGGAVLRRRHRA